MNHIGWPDIDEAGFAVVENILREREVDSLLSRLTLPDLQRSRAGARKLLSNPSVWELARDPRLLAMASRVLGSDAFPFNATLFDKSSRANWLVVWHQDTALPMSARRDVLGWGPWSTKVGVLFAHAPAEALSSVLALRVHLDDSTPTNGPIKVLSGTHRMGVLNDLQIQDLARKVLPKECLVARGGVLAMRPLLLHSSSKASTPSPRRVIHIEYAASRALGNGLALLET